MNDRSSLITKIGRCYQSMPPSLINWLEIPFFRSSENAFQPPMVILISPPRSGSTLTYQLMVHSLESLYLSNLWNLFFGTPMWGGLISNKLCSNYVSDFKSTRGFVPGLCGPSEGYKFWSYWFGQELVDRGNYDPPKRSIRFVKALGYLTAKYDRPFIAGYLGHVFCVDILRKYFSKHVFVFLRRDPLSVAYSILKNRLSLGGGWFSLMPNECKDFLDGNKSIHEQVALQVNYLYKRINGQFDPKDSFYIDYEDICNSPEGFVNDLIKFASERDIQLNRKIDLNIPKNFLARRIEPNEDEDARILMNYLEIGNRLDQEIGIRFGDNITST